MTDIRIKSDEADFKMRVNGLIIQDNHVLLVHINDCTYLSIPGGHVELGETSEEAVIREMKEETQTDCKIAQLLGIVENFFINNKHKKIHELSFYYVMKPLDYMNHNNFTIIENDKAKQVKLAYEWIDINELNNYDIRPSFIKDIIKNQTIFHHMIIDETKK